MKKFLIAVAALFATPVQAQEVSVSVNRLQTLLEQAPEACRIAHKTKSGVGFSNVLFSNVTVFTQEEKVLVLALCNSYLKGRLDQLTGR